MATETEVLKLDLDNAGFLSAAKEAENAIKALGEVESLSGLRGAFLEMAPALAVAGAAVYAFKKAFDLTLEAEQVKQIEAQFNALAASVGLSGETLREKIAGATDGLVDDTDALRAASGAIVALGENADRLPEIFTLARNAARIFGGDVLERVQSISTSLAAGNTRALRQIGLMVDSEAAVKKYAYSLGVTVDMLTESQRKQAILSEALEVGRKKFETMPSGLMPTTVALKQLSVAMSEMAETFAVAVEKKIGPSVSSMAVTVKDWAVNLSLFMKEKLGDSAAGAQLKLRTVTQEIEDLDSQIKRLEERGGLLPKLLPDSYTEGAIEKLKALRTSAQAELASIRAAMSAAKEAGSGERGPASEGITPTISGLTKEQAAEIASDRAKIITQIRELEHEHSMGTAQEAEQREAYIVALKAESQARIDELNAQGAAKVKNLADQEALIRAQTASKIEKIQKDAAKSQTKTYEQMLKTMSLGDQAWTKGLVAAFSQASRGAAAMAKAMRAAIFGVLADEAQARGAKFIAEGIAETPFSPQKIAGGSALVALSSFIRGLGGGGAGGTAPSAGGGGGAAGGEVGVGAVSTERPDTREIAKKRDVVVNIHGNYLETPESRRYLLEMIRQETDATGFTYNQIGFGAT